MDGAHWYKNKKILLGDYVNYFEPQNIEQEISNVEVNTSWFCGFLFDIRYSAILGCKIPDREGEEINTIQTQGYAQIYRHIQNGLNNYREAGTKCQETVRF